MRHTIYMLSFIGLGFAFNAHAGSLSVSNDCDPTLGKRLFDDPKVESTCTAKVTVDGHTSSKTFHTAIRKVQVTDENGEIKTEARLLVREICETCKTEGATQKMAIDFNALANWTLAEASKALIEGRSDASSTIVDEEDEGPEESVDACAGRANPTEVMSCRISQVRNATSAQGRRDAYLTTLQPAMLKLAASKKESDKELLRRSVATLLTTANEVTMSDAAIYESVHEFQFFNQMREEVAMSDRALKLNAGLASSRDFLLQQRQATRTKYETIFRERARYNKARGIDVSALNENSKGLADLVASEFSDVGTSDKSTSSMSGPNPGAGPRTQFGTPGLQQGRGFTPASRPGGTGGGLDRIFHAN